MPNTTRFLSEGVITTHGVWTASHEWYAPWKPIDKFDIEPNTTDSMEMLIEGSFTSAD